MRPLLTIKTLTLAVTSLSVASFASAAGLDRSGQDITAFHQAGTYAEVSYTQIDADVTGYDNSNIGVGDNSSSALSNYNKGNEVGDIAESYSFMRYGVKTDINDAISIGVLYDEPFGAAAAYSGNNNFVANAADANNIVSNLTGGAATSLADAQAKVQALTAAAQNATDPQQAAQLAAQARALGTAAGIAGSVAATDGQATEVEVHSQNITGLLGVKMGNNFQLYGGPAYQRLEGDVALRGPAYLTSSGYDARIGSSDAVGWVAGAAFMKPEIAMRAALTYRSEIEHESDITETLPILNTVQTSEMTITTPESFNFDFQTGLNKTTLATAKVRYVPWSDFSIVPPLYNQASKASYPEGLPLVGYSDDQWMVELGLAKRLSPALALSGTVGWDSGAGNPTTSLGPIEGYYSVGAGAKYNVTPNWAISAGAKYLMFGDAKGALPNKKVVSNFEDNDGYALGVKLSYQGK